MDRDRTNGQRLTAEDMGGDAAPYVEALVQLANEQQRYTPGVFGPRREPLPEKEAVARAVEAVREVRRELWGDREPEGSEPSFEDVEKWERSREDRREQEGY